MCCLALAISAANELGDEEPCTKKMQSFVSKKLANLKMSKMALMQDLEILSSMPSSFLLNEQILQDGIEAGSGDPSFDAIAFCLIERRNIEFVRFWGG